MQLLAGCYFILRWRCGIKMYTGTHSIESSTSRAGAFQEGGAEREKKGFCVVISLHGEKHSCANRDTIQSSRKKGVFIFIFLASFFIEGIYQNDTKRRCEREIRAAHENCHGKWILIAHEEPPSEVIFLSHLDTEQFSVWHANYDLPSLQQPCTYFFLPFGCLKRMNEDGEECAGRSDLLTLSFRIMRACFVARKVLFQTQVSRKLSSGKIFSFVSLFEHLT